MKTTILFISIILTACGEGYPGDAPDTGAPDAEIAAPEVQPHAIPPNCPNGIGCHIVCDTALGGCWCDYICVVL